MSKLAGIWIDHERAIIVTISGQSDTTETIESDVRGHFRSSGGLRQRKTEYGPEYAGNDKHQDASRTHALHRFYAEVIDRVKNADHILLIGPSDAKTEVEKDFRKTKAFASKIAGVETADKMTAPEIVAKVRSYFEVPKGRRRKPIRQG